MSLQWLKSRKNVHVVGAAGAEGAAILMWLHRHGIRAVTIHDFNDEADFEKVFRRYHKTFSEAECDEIFESIRKVAGKICMGTQYLSGLMQADLIFVPQSWYRYQGAEILYKAKAAGIPFKTMTELYLELNPGMSIGVTGANGKTTTSSLVAHFMKACLSDRSPGSQFMDDFEVNLVGNDRLNRQMLHQLEDLSPDSVLVMEISNRQLKFNLKRTPDIVVITNITPNHADEHENFADYVETKKRIVAAETKFVILNYDDPVLREMAKDFSGRVIFFSSTRQIEGVYLVGNEVFYGDRAICSLEGLRLYGEHNRQNVLAAVGAVIAFKKLMDEGRRTKSRGRSFALSYEKLSNAIADFEAVPRRLNLVDEIGGVRYFDDSYSTTPESTIKAIEAFNGEIVLILGGDDKGADYTALNQLMRKRKVKAIALPGSVRERLMQGDVKFFEKNNLEEALKKARAIGASGSAVLISPSGEHFISNFLKGKSVEEFIEMTFNKKKKILTPLEKINERLFFKREDKSPLGSHKMRSLSYQLSLAKERRDKLLAISTSGNAGICAAAFCREAGIPLVIFTSYRTPRAKLKAMMKDWVTGFGQSVSGKVGAKKLRNNSIIIVSNRSIPLLQEFCHKYQVPDLRPSRDDNSIVGMRSLGFELAEQLPNIGDETAIFLYVSSGSGILGLFEAFSELKSEGKIKVLPQLHAVQSGEISSVAWYFDKKSDDFLNSKNDLPKIFPSTQDNLPVENSNAESFNRPLLIEKRAEQVIEAVKKTGGFGWYVNESEREQAAEKLSTQGISTSQEGVMAYAAYLRAAAQGSHNFERAIVVLTGRKWTDESDFDEKKIYYIEELEKLEKLLNKTVKLKITKKQTFSGRAF